ncbi:MAG: TRAM domain-containing protein, partial [Planctomycetes bacterium]|nr:TRAM domain-containing protein [Planctomycetota bacterium]
DLQNRISYEDNQRYIGQTVKILVEGPSKKPHLNPQPKTLYNIKTTPETLSQTLQLVGRTPTDHITVFDGTKNLIGQIVSVKIQRASALTLFAEYIQPTPSEN